MYKHDEYIVWDINKSTKNRHSYIRPRKPRLPNFSSYARSLGTNYVCEPRYHCINKSAIIGPTEKPRLTNFSSYARVLATEGNQLCSWTEAKYIGKKSIFKCLTAKKQISDSYSTSKDTLIRRKKYPFWMQVNYIIPNTLCSWTEVKYIG